MKKKKKKKNRNEKAQILMNEPEPVYLGLSILDLWKTVMYKFWYDYIKPKYGETKFNTLNFEIDRPLPKGKKIKSNGSNER